jgi:predicted transcriptional regulator
VFDPGKEGLEKVLRDYQIEALKVVWANAERGVTSREVWESVKKALESVKTISRASIINFLNTMCDDGILRYKEETCKGGMRRKYFPALDEEGFKRYIAQTVIESLLKDFPDRTLEAIGETLSRRPELAERLKRLL